MEQTQTSALNTSGYGALLAAIDYGRSRNLTAAEIVQIAKDFQAVILGTGPQEGAK